jgi:hypothetical protein
MDPKSTSGMLLAPPHHGGGAASFRMPSREPFPPLDEHLVRPEVTRDEMLRGRGIIAMPALPPHADRHCELDYVIRGNVKAGYIPSTELLTRVAGGSDFATDTCIRKDGKDPASGGRYLEELAFEVVNEQSPRDIREKAEDLAARGVRRMFAVFVKTGQVCEWSREKGEWRELDRDGVIEDECLGRPLRVGALLDAAEADDSVARALVDKGNPVIEAVSAAARREGKDQGLVEGQAQAILAVLAARGIAVSDGVRARILGCGDGVVIGRWIVRAATAARAEDVVAE